MIEIRELVKLPELPVIEMVDDLGQVYKEFMIIRASPAAAPVRLDGRERPCNH